MLGLCSKMPKLNDYELNVFCRAAKTIVKKGHLEINAILKFIGSDNHKQDKKIIQKFYKLQLLKKHRPNTYELTSIGRMFAIDACEWFKQRYA